MSDINSLPWVQFNPLTRLDKFRYYITLPAFNYTPAYTGDSELVTQFNFSSDRNFFLRNRPAKPAGVNYLLCIRYRVGDTIIRYKLWNGVGETGMDDVPLYNANLIKKNFVLEVWSVGVTASQVTDITIITSITGIITDITNVSNAALAIGAEFNSYDNLPDTPVSIPDTLGSQSQISQYSLYAQNTFGLNSWPDTGNAGNGADFTNLGATDIIVAGLNGYTSLRNADMRANVVPTHGGTFFIVCKINQWTPGEVLIKFYPTAGLSSVSICSSLTTPGAVFIESVSSAGAILSSADFTEVPLNTWTIFTLRFKDGVGCFLSGGGSAETIFTTAQTFEFLEILDIDFNNTSALDIQYMLLYGTGEEDLVGVAQAITAILQTFPGSLGWTLPITFDSGMQWLDNV